MDPSRRLRAEAIFNEAADLPPDDRPAFLDQSCGSDAALRCDIERLLKPSDDAIDQFLETPAFTPAHQEIVESMADLPNQIGKYTIVRKVGEGGMGIVLEAKQESPNRTVALKIIRPDLATKSMRRRFAHEVNVLGRLQHPGIAHVYEAGMAAVDGDHQHVAERPFFAMEFIRGVPLTRYSAEHGLGTRRRLELVAAISDAVHHAHQQGVIHRDLKPANILVDSSGQPKILDFGVARIADDELQGSTLLTGVGQLIGTIPYMSPEQVVGDSKLVDTSSDVYALGVIFYELLAGRAPHDLNNRSIPEAARIIRDEQPSSISTLNPVFRGDIDTIVAKAIDKDKHRRYASAAELAADIRRFLRDEPIIARPATALYQLRKFANRNKALVGGVAATFAALFLGVVGMGWLALREADHRIQAELARNTAEVEAQKALAVNEFLNEDLLASISPWKQGIDVRMRDVLQTASKRIAGKFADQPLVEAAVRETLGSTYASLGAYDLAEPHLRRSLDLRRAYLGAEDGSTLLVQRRLARTLKGAGRFDKAETLLGDTLDAQRRVLGPQHQETLASMMDMTRVYQVQSRHTEAEALQKQTLDAQSNTLGDEHEDTLRTLRNLAEVYAWQGKNAEAEPMYRRVLETNQRMHGFEHPATLMSMNTLADLHMEQGRYEQAESLLTRAAKLNDRVFGDDHPYTLTTINSLGLLYLNQGRYAAAEPLYIRALDGFQMQLGEDHPSTYGVRNNLAMVFRKQGKLEQAEPLFAQTLEHYQKQLGDDHINSLSVESNLGAIYVEQNRPDLAEPLLAHCVAGARRTLPSGHWFLGVFLDKYGVCLMLAVRLIVTVR